MPELDLKAIEAEIRAKLIIELELKQLNPDFVEVFVETGNSQHRFCLPTTENISRLVINYMDSQNTLRDKAERLERLWNALSFEYRLITDWLKTHPQGLELIADFRYSPLWQENAWQSALREANLYVVEDFPIEAEQVRHLIVAKDKQD